ncbi:MAG: lipid-A-disaccharide synthase [Mariprofundaceae bacterium]|nr:lipid-A-disaccharide synthase [Mariprofundaceae bacterium]
MALVSKSRPIHVFICAGESSGDMHGAAIIRSLKQSDASIHISAVAGSAMRAEDCEVLCPMESLNVMGIADVLKALPRIQKIGKDLLLWAEKERPDVVVLVDFPGFNMRLGEKLRKLAIPVLYYIAPKLWAWGRWRVKRLQGAQNQLASILPFEPAWFAKRGIEARYVGNPSAVACQAGWSQTELKSRLGMNKDQLLLALLPGSRKSELQRHTDVLIQSYQRLKQHFPDLRAVTTQAPSVSDTQMQPFVDAGIDVLNRLDEGYALRTDAALAVSGTATLELALWHTPTVLVYQTTAMTMWIGKRLVGTNCVGLANIILDDKRVMPELLQAHVNVAEIVAAVQPLLEKSTAYHAQQHAFHDLQHRLGESDPSDEVATMALAMIQR